MPISGVVILTNPSQTQNVLEELQNIDNITTYGVHKDYNIVAVFEADSPKGLEELAEKVQTIDGVAVVNPPYVNFEELDDDIEE